VTEVEPTVYAEGWRQWPLNVQPDRSGRAGVDDEDRARELVARRKLININEAEERPFAVKGFAVQMRRWRDAARLPHCTAHGLRKATMRRGAELKMGNQQIKSLSGQTKDDEIARYTAAASQSRLNDAAIDELSEWEIGEAKANPVARLAFGGAETPRKAG
jgi:hypothetical protein